MDLFLRFEAQYVFTNANLIHSRDSQVFFGIQMFPSGKVERGGRRGSGKIVIFL